mmetsp:Transcript_90528/g.233621  ORF Transcript_90528/g.233621 Transcript_90528/m.233621 type:complete len:259 (-) Transcript_90528:621-1397(-)
MYRLCGSARRMKKSFFASPGKEIYAQLLRNSPSSNRPAMFGSKPFRHAVTRLQYFSSRKERKDHSSSAASGSKSCSVTKPDSSLASCFQSKRMSPPKPTARTLFANSSRESCSCPSGSSAWRQAAATEPYLRSRSSWSSPRSWQPWSMDICIVIDCLRASRLSSDCLRAHLLLKVPSCRSSKLRFMGEASGLSLPSVSIEKSSRWKALDAWGQNSCNVRRLPFASPSSLLSWSSWKSVAALAPRPCSAHFCSKAFLPM